jgi:type I pantothenate kinase
MATAAQVRSGTPADRDTSPYVELDRSAWSALGAATQQPLSEAEIERVRGLGDELDLDEVEQVYLPVSRLLSLYVEASGALHRAQETFLDQPQPPRTPFVIGVAGSVAVGKSTTARVLQALLARWSPGPKVDLVTTDGFLFPNAVLEAEGLMERKGFPESYDVATLLAFLSAIKAGTPQVSAPVYSHLTYDIVPGETIVVDRPDILILEGLNVLQTRELPKDGKAVPFVSDFFDFSIYIDADEDAVRRWYVERFLKLKETRFRDPRSYFNKYAGVSAAEAEALALGLWERINVVNLRDNIMPTRPRADLILRKGGDHSVVEVALRRL